MSSSFEYNATLERNARDQALTLKQRLLRPLSLINCSCDIDCPPRVVPSGTTSPRHASEPAFQPRHIRCLPNHTTPQR